MTCMYICVMATKNHKWYSSPIKMLIWACSKEPNRLWECN